MQHSEGEVWKDITGYEGLYQVSSLGNIKSLAKIVNNAKGTKSYRKERLLNPTVDFYGYKTFGARKDGRTRILKVHKIVAQEFLNHTPSGYKEVVDHIDNDKLNNIISNLQRTSARENSTKDRKNKSSKYRGVSKCVNTGKWHSQIYRNRKVESLGRFLDEELASQAYENALNEVNSSIL
jgi:hypothetical protein